MPQQVWSRKGHGLWLRRSDVPQQLHSQSGIVQVSRFGTVFPSHLYLWLAFERMSLQEAGETTKKNPLLGPETT